MESLKLRGARPAASGKDASQGIFGAHFQGEFNAQRQVLDEIAAWQARPLEPVYPLVFFDALRVKIRDEGVVRNKAVHIALGVRADGAKEILGLWLEQNEGAKFWLRVMNELRNRGVEDLLLAVVDGLKGFPDAIRAVFPEAMVQTCIVHLLRHSLDFVSYKDRKPVAATLKGIYRAIDAAAGEAALGAFEEGHWGRRYPAIAQSWRRAWSEVVPFYAFATGTGRRAPARSNCASPS